jgi:hypothetical protein
MRGPGSRLRMSAFSLTRNAKPRHRASLFGPDPLASGPFPARRERFCAACKARPRGHHGSEHCSASRHPRADGSATPLAAAGGRLGYAATRRGQKAFDASRAPSTSARSLAHMIDGCTRCTNGPCAKPQSVPATTLSRPTRTPESRYGFAVLARTPLFGGYNPIEFGVQTVIPHKGSGGRGRA